MGLLKLDIKKKEWGETLKQRKKKRFSPWLRKEKVDDLECVKQYYGYSNEKASQALKILDKKQLNFIKQRLETGGTK